MPRRHRQNTRSRTATAKVLAVRFNINIWGFCCVIVPAVALAIGATWAFVGAEDRSTTARKLARQAALDASDQQELSDLRTRVLEQDQAAADQKAAYDSDLADAVARDANDARELKKQLDDQIAKNKQLNDALAIATKETVSIKVPTGQARMIGDNSVAVGVQSIGENYAIVQLGDYPTLRMYPGESRAIQVGDRSWAVTLMKIEASSCVFAVRKD